MYLTKLALLPLLLAAPVVNAGLRGGERRLDAGWQWEYTANIQGLSSVPKVSNMQANDFKSGCGSSNQKCSCAITGMDAATNSVEISMKGTGTSGSWTGLDFKCTFHTDLDDGRSGDTTLHIDIPYTKGNSWTVTSNVLTAGNYKIPNSGHSFTGVKDTLVETTQRRLEEEQPLEKTSYYPSASPSDESTAPTIDSSSSPSAAPAAEDSTQPSFTPSAVEESAQPSFAPSNAPSVIEESAQPSEQSASPTISQDTEQPSLEPSIAPTTSTIVSSLPEETDAHKNQTTTNLTKSASQLGSSSVNSLPYVDDCDLGKGFDFVAGCDKSNPFDQTSWNSVTRNVNKDSTFTVKTIADSQDLSKTMESVTSAEGGYSGLTFSVKASVSVDYMTKHSISTNSVSYFMAQTHYSKEERIPSGSASLTEGAFEMFKNNPDSFIRFYGTHFISNIDSGATFTGSLELYQTSYNDQSSLEVFAKIDASTLLFSSSASEDYKTAYNNQKDSLSFSIDGQYKGAGSVVKLCEDCTAANPSQLGDEYKSWYESAKDGQSAARMRMTYESYLTIPQIAEYLGTLSQEQVQKYAAFNPQRIYPATSTALNNEAMQTHSLIKALQNAQSYQCYDKGDDSAGFRTAVKDQLSAAQSHYLTFSKLNENDIIAIQTEGTGSNIWQSQDMQAEYDQLFKDFPSCTLEPVGCKSWLAENCAAQGDKGSEKVNPKDWKEFQGIVKKYMQNDSTTKSKYGNKIGCWDVSSVTDMRMAFFMTSFNEPLKCWDVSGVNNMEGMFYGDSAFNQDLSGWDTSRVKNMASMFQGANNFNGNIIQWNVAKVNNMKSMFAWAESFNQPINGWSVDNVASFAAMFDSAYSFDKDVSSWQVSSAQSFQHMFQNARTFDHDLNRWNNVPRQQGAAYDQMFNGSACPIQSDPTAGAWCQQQAATPTPVPTMSPTPHHQLKCQVLLQP